MGTLTGQVALVTGAGSGVGQASAVALATAGATPMLLVGRRTAALEETADMVRAAGADAELHPLDVSNRAAMEGLAEQALAEHGVLDLLVLSAGINTTRRNLRDQQPDEWDRVVAVNLNGPYYLVRACLPSMRARGRGSVVVVGSLAGVFPGPLSGAAYGASKAAVSSLVKSINAEERRFGIRACVIQLGETDTPIMQVRPFPPTEPALAVMLKPEDVAAAVLYAASQPPWVNVEEIYLRPTAVRIQDDYDKLVAAWEQAGR
jgi:NADP-dependent 3-hydroxy acid dehydrogenase YdfG